MVQAQAHHPADDVTGSILFNIHHGCYILGAGVHAGLMRSPEWGPANASLFYLLYLYQQGWQNLSMGYASAMAWDPPRAGGGPNGSYALSGAAGRLLWLRG